MGRRFSNPEKRLIRELADWRCQDCGNKLQSGWHADHVIPYARGGPTDIINAQALCPRCNFKKGVKMKVTLKSWLIQLRQWQERCRDKFVRSIDSGKTNFTLNACPGAGKTLMMLWIAHWMLKTGKVDRVVFVVPGNNLKEQLAGEDGDAPKVGVQLERSDLEVPCDSEFHGCVVSYHSLTHPDNARAHNERCKNYRTLVFFDEIHHAGINKKWGDGIRRAFGGAAFHVCTSGTLFRTDAIPIAFVDYVDNESTADFSYEYGEALADGVCRKIEFPAIEGLMKWSRDSEEYEHRFADALNEQEASDCLRTALNPDSSIVADMIKRGHEKLMELREHDPDAGGLLIAIDKAHADNLARLVQKLTGTIPTVVYSDNPIGEDNESWQKPSDKIKKFKKSNRPWIVAVRMVSEGVDIPRLRVLVIATNYTTDLSFYQMVGRICRGNDWAYCYMPSDKRMVANAQRILEARRHVLNAQEEEPVGPGGDIDPLPRTPSSYEYRDVENVRLDRALVNGKEYQAELYQTAENLKTFLKSALSTSEIAEQIEKGYWDQVLEREPHLRAGNITCQSNAAEPFQESASARREQLKQACQKAANRRDNALGLEPGSTNSWLLSKGFPKAKECQLKQLEERLQFIEDNSKIKADFGEAAG